MYDIYKRMSEKISNEVSVYRTKLGATQEELASKVGVSRQTIIALEKGNYTPSILLALKIAAFLKLPMKNNILEKVVALALVIIAVLLLNPFNFWMPDMMVMGLLAGTLVLFGLYASFILRENKLDERDVQYRTLAGRNAFLAGSCVLIMGIVAEGYSHAVDPWLVVALIVMVVVKIMTRIWSDRNL